MAGDGPGAAAGERDAPFIFDGVSPNLDGERGEIRGRGDREEELGKTVAEEERREGQVHSWTALPCHEGEGWMNDVEEYAGIFGVL